jgi:hypothetical protein
MSKKKPAKLRLTDSTVNTGFSTATYSPRTGRSTYTLSEPLSAMRDKFYGAANEFLPTDEQSQYASELNTYGQNVFGRGSELLDAASVRQDPMEYYNQQQALLAPNRAIEESRLADTLFKSGRTGAAVGYGQGYLNPEQFALLKAREEANAGLLMNSEDRVRAFQNQDIAQASGLQSLGLGFQDSANTLSMRPYQNAQTLFGVGTGIESLGQADLQTAINQAQTQLSVDQAIQQNETARKGGGFLRSLGSGILNAGLNYATGGLSGAIGGAAGGSGIFSSLGSLFSGSSPTSGLFGSLGVSSNGFGNMVGSMNNTYAPMNSMMGMGGYQAPANFGGGTIAPRFY